MSYQPKDIKDRTLHRLKIANGHLKKVISMVEADKYCIDVIHQSQAIQKALNQIDQLILENHLHTCVAHAIKADNKSIAITEVMQVFKHSSK